MSVVQRQEDQNGVQRQQQVANPPEITTVPSPSPPPPSSASTSQNNAAAATPSSSPRKAATHKLYFAYGSNLSSTQMAMRCPESKAVGLAHLPGWDWIINQRGYANIVKRQAEDDEDDGLTGPESGGYQQQPPPLSLTATDDGGENVGDPGSHQPGVYGILYELPPADEKVLDKCEGVPWAYEKVMLDVTIILSGQDDDDDDYNITEAQKEEGEDPLVVTVPALVYVDFYNVKPDRPRPEYVDRMSRGVREARESWGFPEWFAAEVMSRHVPASAWE